MYSDTVHAVQRRPPAGGTHTDVLVERYKVDFKSSPKKNTTGVQQLSEPQNCRALPESPQDCYALS